MKYSDVVVNNMQSVSDCYDTIDKIEADHRNYSTSLKTWNEGGNCILKEAAKAKIKALSSRAHKLCPDTDIED